MLPAPDEKPKRGHRTTVIAVALALLLVALFGVPGYIAGFYCRAVHDYNSQSAIEIYYSHPELGRRPHLGVEIFLVPACLAMKLAPPLKSFYYRQWNTVYQIDNIHHPHWWRLKH